MQKLGVLFPYFHKIINIQNSSEYTELQKDKIITDGILLLYEIYSGKKFVTQFGFNKFSEKNKANLSFGQFLENPNRLLDLYVTLELNNFIKKSERYFSTEIDTSKLNINNREDWKKLLYRLGYNYFDSLPITINEFQKNQLLAITKNTDSTTWVQLIRLNNLSKDIFIINLLKKFEIENYIDSNYIKINIASNSLELVQDNLTILNMKVISGNPKHPTPTLISEISSIITYPYWNVPRGIAIKEYAPKFEKDPSYADKHNFVLVDSKEQYYNVDIIDWKIITEKTFNYTLRQLSGCDNSLGVLKFYFESPFDIYLHDTNAGYLFSQANRHYSHGCIRIEKYIDLAEFLLKNSKEFSREALELCLKNQNAKWIKTSTKIPLIITYQTLEVNKNGYLVYHKDIYERDKQTVKTLPKHWLN